MIVLYTFPGELIISIFYFLLRILNIKINILSNQQRIELSSYLSLAVWFKMFILLLTYVMYGLSHIVLSKN